MKLTLKLEEFAQLILGVYAFSLLPFAWWWFLVFFLVPDISMIGYAMNNRIGALAYNLFHHKGIAVLFLLIGMYVSNPILQGVGIILFAHAAFDRLLGYGLKYEEGFKFTHLGNL